MYAVGDGIDRVFFRLEFGPQAAADPRRHVAVYAAHAVLEARAANAQCGHVELVRLVHAPEPEELVFGDAEILLHAREIGADHVLAEVVVSRGNRRMRGENGVRRDRFQRGIERQSALHLGAHPLQDEECRMPLVHVPSGRLESDRMQRAHTADAEHDLLLDASALVSAVKPVGDVAVLCVVVVQIGVEQIQGDVADDRLPYAHRHVAARQIDAHPHFRAVVVQHGCHRQIVKIRIAVVCELVAFAVDRLMKIALPVQEADADKRQAHVAG